MHFFGTEYFTSRIKGEASFHQLGKSAKESFGNRPWELVERFDEMLTSYGLEHSISS